MPASNIVNIPNKISGFKPLLSDEYMLSFFKKFCNAITTRMWRFKKAKNSRYDDIDFLKVFFLSEIVGRSIHDTSEMLNEYLLSHKRGRQSCLEGPGERTGRSAPVLGGAQQP